jgi:hypothetical protein
MQLSTMRGVQVMAVLSLLTGGACEKKGEKNATVANVEPGLPELVAKPASVNIATLSAPALLASVPADTPYLITAFEAIPLEYYAKLKQALGPAMGNAVDQFRALAKDADADRLISAIQGELAGKLDAKGLESLGFNAKPRFALYGLGLAPVVFRIEVRDDKVVLATIQRIASRAGITLPAVETKDGRSFWRISPDRDATGILSLADNQLVAAFGRTADVERQLGLILGSEKPQVSMAGGKQLLELMAKHHFGPHMIGFVDTQKLAMHGMAFAGRTPAPQCTSEIDRLSSRVPRMLFGYSTLNAKVASGGMVIELAPDLVTELRAARAEVPGLAEAVASQPMLAFSFAGHVERMRRLALDAAVAMRKLGDACQLADLSRASAEARDTLSKPVPAALGGGIGALLVAQEILFAAGGGGMPERVEGFAAIAAPDARSLYAFWESMTPQMAAFGVKPDGKVYPVTGVPVPFALHAAVGQRTIVVGVGDTGKGHAERLVTAKATGMSPFIVMSYDYGQLLHMQSEVNKLTDDPADPTAAMRADLNAAVGAMFGRAAGTLDVGDHGLAFWATMEMK